VAHILFCNDMYYTTGKYICQPFLQKLWEMGETNKVSPPYLQKIVAYRKIVDTFL